jgi:hypothetical protein
LYPLLITSSIQTSAEKSNTLTNRGARAEQTVAALNQIVERRIFKDIVIADGSNCDLLSSDELADIRKRGVTIEQISFQQDSDDVRKFGKSHGELQIIRHAMKTSSSIRQFGGFYKLSGRYGISNLDRIVMQFEKGDNLFYFDNPPFLPLGGRFVSTIFYKSSLDFFERHFVGAELECSYEQDGYLEAIFYRRLVNLNRKRERVPFPYYEGISGTTGKPLVNRRFVIRDFASRLGLLCFSFDYY